MHDWDTAWTDGDTTWSDGTLHSESLSTAVLSGWTQQQQAAEAVLSTWEGSRVRTDGLPIECGILLPAQHHYDWRRERYTDQTCKRHEAQRESGMNNRIRIQTYLEKLNNSLVHPIR